ncbi:hypothetical protein [Amycolatopsis sp. NPDC059657]|uniref:hypothetical protein n=1 Tax=Amycolatopsis sp. NPDC059657 TaxID=3346899 RepID=UPI00367268FD
MSDTTGMPERPSLLQLRAEILSDGQRNLDEIRRRFEKYRGEIVEEDYFRFAEALVVLVKKGRLHRILTCYNSTEANPNLSLALRSARREERKFSAFLRGRPQEIFSQMIYAVIVHLLGVLDLVTKARTKKNLTAEQIEERLNKESAAAEEDVRHAKEFAIDAAKNAALSWYLVGLMAGAATSGIIVWGLIELVSVPALFAGCLVAGGIGAVVSVMARITHRNRLDVAIERRPRLTVFAGALRPLAGALFGLAFYVLAHGGLLPFKPEQTADASSFFWGLAFLAGFSERWAQDTIVKAAPGQGGRRDPEFGKKVA